MACSLSSGPAHLCACAGGFPRYGETKQDVTWDKIQREDPDHMACATDFYRAEG